MHVGVYMCFINVYVFLWVIFHVRQILTPNHFRALRGMPLIDVGERERTPRHSRRVALSNDTLRGPGRLRRSLRRCAARYPEVSLSFMYYGICVIIGKFIYICVWLSVRE